jgi:hypothetical protein
LVLSMTVDQLLRRLTDLPRRLPVVVDDSSVAGIKGAGLCLASAHFDRRVSGTFLYAGHEDGPDDCQAPVVSAFNQSNPDYLELTEPPMWAPTVDAEPGFPETKEADARSAVRAAPAQGCATDRGRTEGDRR